MWPFSRKATNIPEVTSDKLDYHKIEELLLNSNIFYPINTDKKQSEKALKSMYDDIPEVSAPINYISQKTSEIPLRHVRKRGDKWIDVEESIILKVLSSPNQYQTEQSFREDFIINYLLFGNSYLNKVIPVGSRFARQIYTPPADLVKIKLDDEIKDPRLNNVVKYEINLGNKTLNIDPINIVHAKQPGGEWGIKGRSKLIPAILASKSLRANYEARVRIYEARGAMGIISPKSENSVLTEENAKAVQKKWNEKFGVNGQKSPIMVGSVPLDYTNINPDIKGLMLHENKTQDFQTVCSVLQFPSILLNDNTKSTYNNISSALKMFYINTSMPLNRVFTQALSELFGLVNEKIIADYSDVEALQDDMDRKVKINSTMWNDQVLSENEYRLAMDYDEVIGGERKKENINNIQNGNKSK